MTGQICWLPIGGPDTEKILHLRISPSGEWKPYTAFPQYAVRDYPMAEGSKGWATYQKLIKSGWTLVNSPAPDRRQVMLSY